MVGNFGISNADFQSIFARSASAVTPSEKSSINTGPQTVLCNGLQCKMCNICLSLVFFLCVLLHCIACRYVSLSFLCYMDYGWWWRWCV